MIQTPFHKRDLRKDAKGATGVEFAMVLPPLCILILGLLDLSYRSYVGSVVQGALFEAARLATVGDKTGQQIDDHIRARLKEFSHNATVTINKKSYYDFTGVKRPEVITTDTDPKGSFNQGDCFKDENGNKAYDQDRGKSGLGGSDDIVNYEIVMTYPRLIPMGSWFGMGRYMTVKASTPLRNQPFASRSAAPATVICT